jgi:ADP-ribose pyrophosphatase
MHPEPGDTAERDPPRTRRSTISSRRIYSGRVLNLDIDAVRYPGGSTGELELIRHPGAAAVVPFVDDMRDADARILLIRQFRYAADRFLYEIPAGRIDGDETPIECARRELREEAGCTATDIRSLGSFYSTPGFIDEYIHAFAATGLIRGDASHETDEFITAESISLSGALRMIDRGEIVDAKTIISIFMADRVRQQ